MLRYMKLNDVKAVVRVHLSSFPAFFLSSLGPRFLALFYNGVCRAPEGIAFVYLSKDGILQGFVAGSSAPGGFYSRMLKRDWFSFAMASIIPVFKNPSIIRRLARAVSHPSKNPHGEDIAGLFSIGVLPELHGSGLGQRLVQAFLHEAKERGCRKVFLTTDRDDNEYVNSFYAKMGFSVQRQFVTPEGRRMNEYWLNI